MTHHDQAAKRDHRLDIPELGAGIDLLRIAPASCALILSGAAILGFGIGWLANL